MIGVMLDDGKTEVFLTRVDHVRDAESAAQRLWESLHKVTTVHGGSAMLFTPEDLGTQSYAVCWHNGPNQWADAYVVSDGADALGFVATAEGGDTVVFKDTD